jgi:membrane dipeptidase
MSSFDRRTFIAGAAATAALAAAPGRAAMMQPAGGRRIVIDGLGAFGDPYGAPEDALLSARVIQEMAQTGVSAVMMTLGEVGNAPGGWEALQASVAEIDKAIADNGTHLVKVSRADDLAAAAAANKLGLMYCTQDTSMVGTQLDRLADMRAMGIRQVQLTYNLRNLSGDGALEPANGGLSRLGRATIARIEAERLLLDLSHGGALTIAEAITASTRPAIISHTGCRALNDNPRNVSDESLRAIAEKGGVVGIYFMPFLTADSRPTGADLIRHLTHARDICGAEHISIGTDGFILPQALDAEALRQQGEFYAARAAAGIAAPGEGPDIMNVVADYNSLDKFTRLADDLGRAGWSERAVDGVMGQNLLRLYRDVW